MNPDKSLREKGDFTRVAASMRASGEAFVNLNLNKQWMNPPVIASVRLFHSSMRPRTSVMRSSGKSWAAT